VGFADAIVGLAIGAGRMLGPRGGGLSAGPSGTSTVFAMFGAGRAGGDSGEEGGGAGEATAAGLGLFAGSARGDSTAGTSSGGELNGSGACGVGRCCGGGAGARSASIAPLARPGGFVAAEGGVVAAAGAAVGVLAAGGAVTAALPVEVTAELPPRNGLT
jgi:hypothetical protein